MKINRTCAISFLIWTSIANAQESPEAKQANPEEIVKAAIEQFHEGIRSDDPKVREEAFEAIMPDEKTFKALFGDDTRLIWPRMKEILMEMRDNLDKVKEEFDGHGKIVSIDLTDVRQDDELKRYQSLLETIPKDIPIFDAVQRFETGASGSGAYVVIEGRMKFIKNLDRIARFIDEQKKDDK